ncbi:MAG TPA: response regulator, partial [Candidatus Sulfotelmatobacter sp.]|nr:response regulator [Candidatus Sulfotelmatobacter sp.]
MGIKILLADDSVTAQNMGKKILSEAGHEVVTVSNGAAAAKKIAEIKPELVLLDVFMPGYSGLELCEKLRSAAETSKIPVLLTVGRMEPYNAQDGARVKADGVIVKPFEATDLTAAVDRIAEKVKPGKATGDSARGIKIVEKQPEASVENVAASAATENAATSGPAQQEEKPYDKTVRLNSAHVQAMLQHGPGHEAASAIESSVQESSSATAANVPDFHVGPVHAAEIDTFQGPAEFKSESENKAVEASIPSFMSQYLPETQEEKAPEAAVLPEPSMHEQPTGAFPIHNELLIGQTQNEIHGERRRQSEPAVSGVPELELTAAAPVPDVPIANEPGLELTRQSASGSGEILPDPALETDPHRSTMDFPTHFGTSEADLANQFLESLQHPATNSAAPADEFEARLNAAMESYEAPPIELPTESSSPNAELMKAASHFEAGPTVPNDSFEAKVDAAMQGFDLPAPAERSAAAPEVLPEVNLDPTLSPAPESDSAEFQIAPVIEMPAPRVGQDGIDDASIALASGESTETIEIIPPETDDAMIQQMRDSLSHHPVEAAPMAMAAAASAASPSAPPSLAHDAEAEIGRAMA